MRYLLYILALILPLSALAAESEPEPTKAMVRAVSKGAKIIGSDVGGARITITDVETGEVLASGGLWDSDPVDVMARIVGLTEIS